VRWCHSSDELKSAVKNPDKLTYLVLPESNFKGGVSMDQKVIDLLEDINRLLILDLSVRDVPGKRVAEVLGVDPAVISRILSSKKSKR
jgi:hypothetical protein